MAAQAEILARLRPAGDFDRLYKRLITHPFFIGLLLAGPALKLLGYMPREYGPDAVGADLLAYAFRVLPFAIAYYYLGGRVTRALMARGFSFAVADFMLWMGWSVAAFVILDLGMQGWGLVPGLVNFLSMQAFVLILHVLKLLHFEQMIRAAIFVRPAENSLWSGKDRRATGNRIAPDLQGELLHIQAQNQYVMVTTTAGARLVRMSMQRALESVPDDAGICIHRSWWVSRALLARAAFDAKRSAVIAADGKSYPVSKANRLPLRDLMTVIALEQQGRAGAFADEAVGVAKTVS